MAMPASCRLHPGRPWVQSANTGRMMNIPKRRSPKIAASERLARSSLELMRAVEFTESGGWSRGRRLMYISRFPYGNDPDTRGADPQPQECQHRHSAQQARRRHGPLGLGQIVPRVRYALRRGPAPLRRIALGLRAAIPAAHGKARRRPDRGTLARDRHRAEGDLAQPALDR